MLQSTCMDFETVIKNRISVRTFLPKPVEKEKINTILELTTLAPSAGNLQAYKIFVIQKTETMKLIDVNIGGTKRTLADVAPLVLVFCANPQESASKYAKRGITMYSIQDATIASAHAQLIASSLHLGTCWVGSFEETQVQQALKTDLPVISLLLVGYPTETPVKRPKKSISQLSTFM